MQRPRGEPDIRTDLFGGQGAVCVWNLAGAAALGLDPFTAVLQCELDPGASVGGHKQAQFAEIVIGLEGEGEATVDGEVKRLCAGDVVAVATGAMLGLRNRSNDQSLWYLIVKARVG